MNIPAQVTVIFDIWGQRSQTEFDATSELDPLTWLRTCYDKGFCVPVEIVTVDGVVLYEQEALMEMVKE